MSKIFTNEFPYHGRGNALVVVVQHVAYASHLGPRDFRVPGFRSSGRRRLASKTISTLRFSSYCFCQSVSKASSGRSARTWRTRSIASTMSSRCGECGAIGH